MEASFRTNFHGPLNITRAFLPMMREKGTGTLVYISSQAAWHVEVGAGAYSASKFALEELSFDSSLTYTVYTLNSSLFFLELGIVYDVFFFFFCSAFPLKQENEEEQREKLTLQKGAVETLSKELSILAPNIKVIIIEPGYRASSARRFSTRYPTCPPAFPSLRD